MQKTIKYGVSFRWLFCLCFFFSISAFTFAQDKITGIIADQAKSPLPGATVFNETSNTGNASDANGLYTITGRPGDVLIFSFVGFTTQRIRIGNEVVINVSLEESSTMLDEVVVAGYATQRVKEIAGSVAIVKPEDLTAIPAGQAEQMLQGRVAGLNVITSGQPGAASNVRLHGIGNFGDVTPLYIIDGVQGNINSLNPNDIESLQVLKDAGAYAIYGVRGANGVIVITTRGGKTGKTKISYDFYAGVQQPLKNEPELLSPQEMGDLTWIAHKNSLPEGSNENPSDPFYGNGTEAVVPDYFIADTREGYFEGDPLVNPALHNTDASEGNIYQIVKTNKAGTDWFNEVFKPAFSQSHSLTVSGSYQQNKYLFSLGYLDQHGTALNTYLKRYTARINTEFNVSDNFRIGENLQLAHRDNPRIASQPHTGGVINEILQTTLMNPAVPVHDIEGGWAHIQPLFFDDNPVALRAIAKDDKAHSWEVFGNIFAEADFLKYFTLRTSFGGSLVNYYSYNFAFLSYHPIPYNNTFYESSGYRRSWTWTNTVKFSHTFDDNHFVTALVGIEAIDNYSREVGGSRGDFFTTDINYRFLSNGLPSTQNNYSVASASTLGSFISRVDYGFKEKYLFTGTLRRDGSSVFDPQNRYGWFPSLSVAWRITEESFMTPLTWITDIKIRASWGKTGFYGNTDPFNQFTLYGGSVADAYYDIYGTSNSPEVGLRSIRLGDPNTGWQEDVVTNVGFESILWNGALSVTADVYKKKANGLLFPVSLPDVLGGATKPNVNVGVVQNTGIDLLIGSKGKFSNNWQWNAAVTFTTYHNEILKLNALAYFIPPPESALGYVRNEVGQPVSSFYGYKIIGIFKDAEEVSSAPMQNAAAPGRFRYLDANNDSIINADDRVHFGNANPNFTAGINIGINFKSFDFSMFWYGSFGNEVINYPRITTDFFMPMPNSAKSKALLYDSWTPENTNASIPMIENNHTFSNSDVLNSYALEDGSYFRNKSMILGYSLPSALLQKIRIERLRLYVQAVNMFTFTDYQGFDPELSGQSAAFGIDFANYPNNQKQYVVGLSVHF